MYAQQQLTAANAKIIVDSFSFERNRVISIGIIIELENDWHIYWRNPGDSGMPTAVEFELPDGVKISEIAWPAPKVFEYEGLASYGYDKEVLLLAELILPENYESNTLTVTANIKSLICRDVCIPFNVTVTKEIKLTNTYSADDKVSSLFSQTRENLPEVKNYLKFSILTDDDKIALTIEKSISNSSNIKSLYFLPYENGLFKNTVDQKFRVKDNKIELVVEYDQFKTKELKELSGILIVQLDDAESPQKVYEIKKQINTNN